MRRWVVLLAALVAAVSAKHDATIQKRPEEFNNDDVCVGALNVANPIYSGLPTPPPSLLTKSLPFDACATDIAFSGDPSAASQFSSYTSEVKDWYTSHRAELQSALASCTSLASYLTMDIPVCLSSTSAGSSTTGISTGPGPTSTAIPTSTAPNAAPPRRTDFAYAGAAAAAGFLGIVAVL
ncbi:infection structure specific protein [Hypoxylon rubiginosum]|uniref:Infection structure specific protein n=1 Tax=Hypoxylon rubiginosum TaxID=110542 RepID=A0ACC0CZ66_9PEZI|nr:infection structure specific protein [Hypoxylon rubiginosum]